jgi:peptide-methionine (S)-S-oxide reductase
MEKATLAGGCFWCTEAIFKRLKGVTKVTPGYSGGMEKPTYEAVSSGTTGHAEAIQIEFDPDVISYEKLLEVFFHLHDPTTLNRQGNDVGTQYRSVIFYHDEKQKEAAEAVKTQISKSGMYPNSIVTEILPFEKFYQAEDYHLDYYAKNSDAPYCRVVIDPKITKLYKEFKNEVKEEL